jgi:hypothetical protein
MIRADAEFAYDDVPVLGQVIEFVEVRVVFLEIAVNFIFIAAQFRRLLARRIADPPDLIGLGCANCKKIYPAVVKTAG